MILSNAYKYDELLGVWLRPGFKSIGYNDGDCSEESIFEILNATTDLSAGSRELSESCSDWPSRYHLSPLRLNVVRPFEKDLSGDILEIGSGCGAITRFLGETAANVVALEGSLRRARITKARVRDLDNVHVVAESFQDFTSDNRFDVITLIGVLEYANLFCDGPTPQISLLKQAKKLLKPEGFLLIAIENQIGLKYFCGAPEDHLGIEMYGIEGRYANDEPQTFGRNELIRILQSAGFRDLEFAYPFPDYKFPNAIIFEQGMVDETFNSSVLAAESVLVDPQLPKELNFSPDCVWPVLEANGIHQDLANSFIIKAGSCRTGESHDLLAIHYSVNRRPQFCKQKVFVKDHLSGSIRVKTDWINKQNFECLRGPISCQLESESVYHNGGEILSSSIARLVSKPYWSVDELFNKFDEYLTFMDTRQRLLDIEKGIEPKESCTYFDGTFFDVIPKNIYKKRTGLTIFDAEWSLSNRISRKWLLFRALLDTLSNCLRVAHSQFSVEFTCKDLFFEVYKRFKLKITDRELDDLVYQEAQIQSYIKGISEEDCIEALQAWLRNPIHSLNRINSSKNEIADLNNQIIAIKESRSWRITKPLRRIKVASIKNYIFDWLSMYAIRLKIILRYVIPNFLRFSTFKKAWELLRHKGFRGIFEKIIAAYLRLLGQKNNYDAWLKHYENFRFSRKNISSLKRHSETLKFTIIIDTREKLGESLCPTIESVTNQIYKLVDIVLVENDGLVRLGVDNQSSKISFSNLRDGVSTCDLNLGTFVGFLDPGDLLPSDSLSIISTHFNERSSVADIDFIYSDHDLIDASGTRSSPSFKPDFDWLLFLSTGYIKNCFARDTLFMKNIQELDSLSITQYFDNIILRNTDLSSRRRVLHIASILFHRNEDKVKRERLLNIHDRTLSIEKSLAVRGLKVNVLRGSSSNQIDRVIFPIPEEVPSVGIIIPTRDRVDLLRTCVESILGKSTYPKFELVVVDNGSQEQETEKYLRELKSLGVSVMRDDDDFNFSRLINLGASNLSTDFICLLNNDVEVLSHDWLEELVSHGSLSHSGVIGARLWYPEGTLQHAGVILGLGGLACHANIGLDRKCPGYENRAAAQQCFSAVTAACLLVKRETFEQVRGFDERLAVAFNDVDFCLRVAELGYQNIWTPYSELIHHESASRGLDESPEKMRRLRKEKEYMWKTWKWQIDNDPCYNRNLTFETEDFSLAWPPRGSLMSNT